MAAAQWPQQYQQYQQQPQQPQHYQQSQQYAHAQQYQQPQQYQQNEQYQAQQYQYHQQPQGYSVQQYQHNQQYQASQYQQLQHGQSTQQYQQVRQGPPVAQHYSQTQPSQPAQQYAQQQFQQPQQAYNGYQHQNAPHQYPIQQYGPQQQGFASQHGPPPAVHISPQRPGGPQQHGTSQYGAYQQTRQPQRNPVQGQSPPQTAPQPCFNCGNTGHFAMDCPEPIRAVPAGKANPQAFQNPLRRPKTGGTVANTPQYPPHPNQVQEPPRGYPSPHYGQTGYAQYPHSQQAHSPSTSPSTQSSAQAQYYQQWQQYYQSQQAYQQGNHQQGSQNHQQPYAAPHGQAIGYPNGPQTPSQTSVQASPHASGIQTYQTQSTPTLTARARLNPSKKYCVHSFGVPPTPPSPIAYETRILGYDFEEDDLNSLDIPDLPQTTLPFTNVSWQPVNLISQPLPANSIVADALAPFPSPAPQDEGRCRSKYQYDASFNACSEHFRNSKYWDKEHADDVVFSDIPADKIVPVDEVLSMIKQRHTHPGCSDEFNRSSRSQSLAVSLKQDSLDVNTTLNRVERELAETKAKLQAKLGKGKTADAAEASPLQSIKVERAQLQDQDIKQEYQTPPQSATSEIPMKSEPDAEDVLAALGVTGTPKPVTATPWPDAYTGYGSPHDIRVSRSGSSSRADILSGDQNRPSSSSGQVAIDNHPNGSISSKQRSVPPPPPPPPPIPFGQQSYRDGTYGSPLSAGTTSANACGHSANGVDQSNANMNGYVSPSTDGQAPSPMETRSEKSHNRKRHRDSSSDEEDTPKRRQEDDYTPKLKKRQPKVAEAYGRRW